MANGPYLAIFVLAFTLNQRVYPLHFLTVFLCVMAIFIAIRANIVKWSYCPLWPHHIWPKIWPSLLKDTENLQQIFNKLFDKDNRLKVMSKIQFNNHLWAISFVFLDQS